MKVCLMQSLPGGLPSTETWCELGLLLTLLPDLCLNRLQDPITIYNATQQTPNSHKTPGTYRDDLPGLFTFVASCFHNAKRPRLLFEDSVFCRLFAPVFPVYQLMGTRSLFSVRGSPSEGASQKGAYKGFTFWFCIVLGLVEHARLRLFRKLAFFFPSEYKKQNK